jgi:hypothetical protein
MNLEETVSKYVASAEHVLRTIVVPETHPSINTDDVRKVIESAKTYLEDAKYYRDKRKLAVGLTSVAYCEGLLDALKLLGVVRFEWPTNSDLRREK